MESSSPHTSLLEPLTRRELAILKRLAQDLSNQEIAQAETLALSSVKWYVQQIYAKLGVNSRLKALAKAKELGLLGEEAAASQGKPVPPLPTGTVTFLFTDIEGSTPLWEAKPQAMKAAVARHHTLLRQAIEAHQGHIFKIIGDSFQASFALPPQALSAALEAQRLLQSEAWGETGPLLVRMGLHTGQTELEGFDYAVSHTLNRTARIMSAGHGRQILLSSATVELLRGQLPQDVTLKDLGEHLLKGLLQPEHIFQASATGLPSDFPALNSLLRQQNNLPVQLTSFIGRQKEIAEASRLVGENRLVTLTGSGGAGKTRLAIQVGMELRESFPHGAWFVDLTPLADPALLAGTILAGLGVRGAGGDPTMLEMRGISVERLALDQFLERKSLLLILDNCEHLVEACARLAEELLRLCPGLKLLATSREALGVPGEKIYHVPSLSLPDPQGIPGLEAQAQSDAVRLFIERAEAADERFTFTEGNAAAVAQICRRLDGIPLAIELAAARLRVMSAAQIAGRMDDLFRLLTAGSRTALPRHQTLRAAIEWSYNLLTEAEKAVFRRLAVFRGGWSLEAAEAVCAGEGIEPFDALDLLGRLVEKSLAIKEEQNGQARYRMLEMIRQYAERQLYASESEDARNRHLDWFLRLAETAAPRLRTGEQIACLDRLELEHDNLRAALRWSLEGKHGEEALRLVAALWYFWQIHSHEIEGLRWMQQALDLAEQNPALRQSLGWARAVVGNVELTAIEKDTPALRRSLEEAMDIFRQQKDLSGVEHVLRILAYRELRGNQLDAARQHLLECLAILQEAPDPRSAADATYLLGCVASWRGDYPTMRAYYQKSQELYKTFEDQYIRLYPMFYIAWDLFVQGDVKAARALFQEGLKISETLGSLNYMTGCFNFLSVIAWIEGDYAGARELAGRAYRLMEEMGGKWEKWSLSISLCNLAEADWRENHVEAAHKKASDALELARQFGDRYQIRSALYVLGRIALTHESPASARKHFEEAQNYPPGDPGGSPGLAGRITQGLAHAARLEKRYAEAKRLYHESLNSMWKALEVIFIPESLEGLAMLSVDLEEDELAARLFGAALSLRERMSYKPAPVQQAEIEGYMQRLFERLAVEEFERLWQEGQAMTLEEALREAGVGGEGK